jgi:hypothetical protein
MPEPSPAGVGGQTLFSGHAVEAAIEQVRYEPLLAVERSHQVVAFKDAVGIADAKDGERSQDPSLPDRSEKGDCSDVTPR